MVVIHLCVKLSVSALFMAMSGILKFPSLKTIYTHAIQHFYYVSSNSEHFKFFTCFVATAAILKFLSLKIMCTHVRQNFWKVSSNSKHRSKPTMNINLQHHNLLGNQISPKSEDFCIWLPFYTLVTMATAVILNCFNPQKLSHTTVDIPTKWIIIWLPNHEYQFPTSKSAWKPNFAQIGGFLYFGGHFGLKMAAIANQ